ncbi:hypothetical protein FHS41_003277 [Streptomyces violarus]|uniref:Uncharacterized protein n=1 Tax=Streptomyces violarus TaxID=67380 RepID=A0A7W5F1R9_9ACTN|nr:hypothetical protein [Streptomyces violarus]
MNSCFCKERKGIPDTSTHHTGKGVGPGAMRARCLDPQKLKLGEGRRGTRTLRLRDRQHPYDALPYAPGDRVGNKRGQHRPTAQGTRCTGRVGMLHGPATAVPVRHGLGVRLGCVIAG